MRIKNIFSGFVILCLLNACVPNYITWTANKNIKKLELGMKKEQVIAILGEKYMVASASKDEYGNVVQVLGYKSDSSEEYKLKFVNNELKEWNREHISKYIAQDPPVKTN